MRNFMLAAVAVVAMGIAPSIASADPPHHHHYRPPVCAPRPTPYQAYRYSPYYSSRYNAYRSPYSYRSSVHHYHYGYPSYYNRTTFGVNSPGFSFRIGF